MTKFCCSRLFVDALKFPAAPALAALLLGMAVFVPQTRADAKKKSVRPKAHVAEIFAARETLGGGSVTQPAEGPQPAFGLGGPDMVLVKNWRFGKNGTIKNYDDMNASFLYHDQFGNIANGKNYGAVIVAPDRAHAVHDGNLNRDQPCEGVDCPPVRRFTQDSLQTFLVPLDGAATVDPNRHNAGNGSFMAKWKLPGGGSLLGRDIVWETRVRYVTPPYFWFALWTAGNQWSQGAEQDIVESFGYDNPSPDNHSPDNHSPDETNYDGRFWHSNTVAGADAVDYSNWHAAMNRQGVGAYDPAQYHVWTWVYRHDDTYAMYVDGVLVQSGSGYRWTLGGKPGREPVDMDFLFDCSWGHTSVQSVDHVLPASAFVGKFYEWSYSRVYLSRRAYPVAAGEHGSVA